MDQSLKERILSYTESHAKRQIELTEALCSENSYTYNPAGTNRVANMVLRALGGLLPHRETIEEKETGSHHVLRSRESGRSICLLGHLDTVFPPDHPFQSCEPSGDWLKGPGTGDMKGGIAVIVYALKALHDCGVLDSLAVTLILGADEEIGSPGSRDIYEREREAAIACLCAECAGPAGEIVVSRNGKAGARLECEGEERHVGSVSGAKASAVLEIARMIEAVESLNDWDRGIYVNVGMVEGGLGPSTVPGHASCLVDLRWKGEEQYAGLLDHVRRTAGNPRQPGCNCRLVVLNHRPAMPPNELSETMFEELVKTAEPLGDIPGREHRRGTSDANFFGSAGVPTLDGFGPVCIDDHTSGERILVPSLASRTSLLALFLATYGAALCEG